MVLFQTAKLRRGVRMFRATRPTADSRQIITILQPVLSSERPINHQPTQLSFCLVISSSCDRGGLSRLNGGRHKGPVSLPMCVAAAVVVLPFVMRFYLGGFGVIGHDNEASLTCALRARSLE